MEAKRFLKIFGLQKLTLLDYPGKVACTVFTGGCNLRCPFCHNASLVNGHRDCEAISEEAFFTFLAKRRGILDGVCISGGEPLLQPDLESFLRRIKELGYLIKLDTNGCFFERLKTLVTQGLVDYVAMDLKSSSKDYSSATGIPDVNLSAIRESIEFLSKDTVDSEFRTTVVRGLHDSVILQEAAQMIRGAKRYFLQKFVDSGNLVGSGMSAFSDEEMETFLNVVTPYVKTAALRGCQ